VNTVVYFQTSLKCLYTVVGNKPTFKYIVYYAVLLFIHNFHIRTFAMYSLVKTLTLIKNIQFEKSQNLKVL